MHTKTNNSPDQYKPRGVTIASPPSRPALIQRAPNPLSHVHTLHRFSTTYIIRSITLMNAAFSPSHKVQLQHPHPHTSSSTNTLTLTQIQPDTITLTQSAAPAPTPSHKDQHTTFTLTQGSPQSKHSLAAKSCCTAPRCRW